MFVETHYLYKNLSLKFHKDPSFSCGDICKTILTFKNHQFSMYFPYFHCYAPQKSSKMDNYWKVVNFLWKYTSKCMCLMDKRTPVPAYRLLSSLSNKQKVFNSSQESHCIMRHNFIILTSKLQRENLWFYISAKNGSVFKTIPEIHRKEIIRMELLNWRFTLRYKSKPKRNFFLGHPVVR